MSCNGATRLPLIVILQMIHQPTRLLSCWPISLVGVYPLAGLIHLTGRKCLPDPRGIHGTRHTAHGTRHSISPILVYNSCTYFYRLLLPIQRTAACLTSEIHASLGQEVIKSDSPHLSISRRHIRYLTQLPFPESAARAEAIYSDRSCIFCPG